MLPSGITIVPPSPQEEIASLMAGTSSVEEEPPALGVQAARGWRVESWVRWTLEGCAWIRVVVVRMVSIAVLRKDMLDVFIERIGNW